MLRKPIIIIDGFDPGEDRNAHKICYDRLAYNDNGSNQNLGDDLRRTSSSNGYDVIVLNLPKYYYTTGSELVCPFWPGTLSSNGCFIQTTYKYRTGGSDFIERNAFVLVELIKRINQQLQANGSNEKITVIGPSMGGLISRYALRYMEQNNMNANCKLWVSFDSPHHGANVNLGLQFWLRMMQQQSPEAGVALREQLESPAAKQMAIQHHLGLQSNRKVLGAPGFRDRFAQTMNTMGFPQASCMRKVALNNGSKGGTFQSFNKCTQAMKVTAEFKPVAGVVCWALFPAIWPFADKICSSPILEAIAYTAPAYNEDCFVAAKIKSGYINDGYMIKG